jgi:hypothetical protein
VTSAVASFSANRAHGQAGDAGTVSPLLVLLLVVVVALFLFSAVAVSRGGLSASGGLPLDERGRRAMFQRRFGPTVIGVEDVTLTGGCHASHELSDIPAGRACVVEVAASGSTPRTWAEKIAATIRSGRRRALPMTALQPIQVTLQQKDGSQPINAKFGLAKHTSFTIAPEGATILITCQGLAKCEIDLTPPAEET